VSLALAVYRQLHGGESMTRRSFIDVTATSVLVLLVGPVHAWRAASEDGLRAFRRALDEYMALRQSLEAQMPSLRMSGDPHQIRETVQARGDTIRRARARAQRGDIFNADVSALFRAHIQQIVATRADAVAELMREMNEHGRGVQAPMVNGEFSWRTAAATPPPVLMVLPPLPDELQYRFVGPDLVLVDVDADIVLDVLSSVLVAAPPTRQRRSTKGGRYRTAHVDGGDNAAALAVRFRGR
jgi:hypothetical protein